MPSKLYDYCQYHQLCWECWGNILSLHRNVNKEEHNKNYPQKCWLCVDGFPLFGLSLACFPLSRRNRVLCDGFENCKCSFATPPFLTSYNSPFSFPSQVLTAMLAVCARLLLLLPLVCCVPSPSRPPSRLCRRCCDHSEPPAATAQYQMPEVRTVINMTILKGTPELRLASECCWLEDPVRSFCFFIPQFVLSVLAGWRSALFTRVSFQILVHEANLMLVVARSFTEKKRKNILEYLCYRLLLSSLVSLIRSLLLAFPRWLSVWHDFYLIRRVIMNIVMEQWRWSVAVHSRLNGAETKKRNRLWLDARQIKRTWNCLKIKKQPRFKGVFLKEGGCQSNNDSHSFRQSVSPKIHINIWIYV